MSERRHASRLACLIAGLLAICVSARADPPASYRIQRWYDAPAALQAVAVDAKHFYAIGNRRIEKHDRETGALLTHWMGPRDGPIVHLNSGIVLDGVLYCAHSNYPSVPMVSSIERFDARTLEHLGSHDFGVFEGSATWVDRHDGHWWVAFANYDNRGGTPGRGTDQTVLVEFDDAWRPVARYRHPPALLELYRRRSNSGGAWGPDGLLYLTGHDDAAVYAVRVPEQGSVLELVSIIPAPIEGQGIAFDPLDPGRLWGIVRPRGRVIAMEPTGH